MAAATSTTPMTPLGSPRIPSSPPDRVAAEAGEGGGGGAHPTPSQRRTSWRDWGTSLGSWATTTTSPFRAGITSSNGRPLSSSSNSNSPFSGFGSRTRAEPVVVIPQSEVAKKLAEQEEIIIEEGERLRLPPTPAELEALEAAGVQDEDDLRLEAEERQRVRSMPPPPRHPSVFGRLSGRLSAQSSPRSEMPSPREKNTLPAFPEDGEESPLPIEKGPATSKNTLASPVELPPIPIDDDTAPPNDYFSDPASRSVVNTNQDDGVSSVKDRPSDAPTLTPSKFASYGVPAVMVSSATSSSIASKLVPESPADSVIPSPSHSPKGDPDAFSTPMTPDTRFGYDSGAYELPSRQINLDARRAESEISASGNNTESESESTKEDLIPADMYQDSEPEADQDSVVKSGSSTPEINERRKSRGTQDRFSLLLSSLSRPNGLAEERADGDTTPLVGNGQPQSASDIYITEGSPSSKTKNLKTGPSSNSEYAASSASSYGESDAGSIVIREADETIVLDDADHSSTQTEEHAIANIPTVTTPPPVAPASLARRRPSEEDEDEEDGEKVGTPVIRQAEVRRQSSSDDEPGLPSSSTRSSVSHNAGPMRSLGDELSEATQHVSTKAQDDGLDEEEEEAGLSEVVLQGEGDSQHDSVEVVAVATTTESAEDVSSPRADSVVRDKSESSEDDGAGRASSPAVLLASESQAKEVGTGGKEEEKEEEKEEGKDAEKDEKEEKEKKEEEEKKEEVKKEDDEEEVEKEEEKGLEKPLAGSVAENKDEEKEELPTSVTAQSFVSFSQSLGDVSEAAEETAVSKAAVGEVLEVKEEEAVGKADDEASPVRSDSDHVAGEHGSKTPLAGKNANEPVAMSSAGVEAEEEEDSQPPNGTFTHNRLMDALGLARSESPAPSMTSASSFASAISEGDAMLSADDMEMGEGAEQKGEDQEEGGGDEVQMAEVKIEDAEPLKLVEPPQSVSDEAVSAEDETPAAAGLEVEAPQLLGSPRIPGSPSSSSKSISSSRPTSTEVSPDRITVTDVGEGTPTPAQTNFSRSAVSPSLNGTRAGDEAESLTPVTPADAAAAAGAGAGLSPNLARPARSRNRKGPAPTPPAPVPATGLTAEGPASASSPDASRRSSTASTASSLSQTQSTPSPASESTVALADGLEGTAPAAAAVVPPSRPPRARPPRAKGRAATAAAAAALAITSDGPQSPPAADSSVPSTPVTPGGSKKKVQRKAVPRAA
ncbi:hypothetical protein A4X13_0g4582 [Tilletia indica]|uniref:Uncharacterized protein n=1 Tax=Tilletia indica TaxID=43049 RepID=A0A177TEL7_9BASI|nr:hypothetical protein A4X13_0g4582 [Tilletia indica]